MNCGSLNLRNTNFASNRAGCFVNGTYGFISFTLLGRPSWWFSNRLLNWRHRIMSVASSAALGSLPLNFAPAQQFHSALLLGVLARSAGFHPRVAATSRKDATLSHKSGWVSLNNVTWLQGSSPLQQHLPAMLCWVYTKHSALSKVNASSRASFPVRITAVRAPSHCRGQQPDTRDTSQVSRQHHQVGSAGT